MGLNVNDAPKGGVNRVVLDAGAYPARLVQVIDLGMHPQSYEGEEKAPAYEAMLTYEFSDEFLKDKEGEDMKDKPIWLSEQFAVKHISSEKAKSTQRYNALDPKNKAKGDFSKCIGFPVMVTLAVQDGKGKNKGKQRNKITATSVMRDKMADALPALVNEPRIFNLDDPDIELFKSFPDWLQEKIIANLEFPGSKLEALLEGAPVKESNKPADDLDDEIPF